MASKEGYDVLRLIEHGQICYISSEYIEGRPLVWWLKYHPNISKQQLLAWMGSMAKQLAKIHKCKKKPCYQYVNPYSMVVTEEGELYFLDLEAGANEGIRKRMLRRDIREHFLPSGDSYYGKGSIPLDIYGLGKTFQYLLASVRVDPPLGRRETAKLKKIISKCQRYNSKHSYQSVQEICKDLPIYQIPKEKRKQKKGKRIAAAGILILLILFGKRYFLSAREHQEKIRKQEITKREEKGGKMTETSAKEKAKEESKEEAYLEVALSYFLDMQEYEKCLSYLEKVETKDEMAEAMKVVVRRFTGKEQKNGVEAKQEEKKAAEALEELEQMILEREEQRGVDQGQASREQKTSCYRFLIKGYENMTLEGATEQVIRLCEECLEWEDLTEETEKEICESMALACEREKRAEEGAACYERILELETGSEKRKVVYQKMVMLYEVCGNREQALSVCLRGAAELPECLELKISHIRLLCQDQNVDRSVCAQTIQTYLSEDPKIQEQEEFKKLQAEYEIGVEGEQVWVGK